MSRSFLEKAERFLERLFRKKQLIIFLLGLDKAGKTTFLNYLKEKRFTSPSRTMGANFEEIVYGGVKLSLWDIGGQPSFRTYLWPKIVSMKDVDIILWIVDSADQERMIHSEEEFSRLLSFENIKDIPLGIIANKQDLEGAISAGEVAVQLRIMDLGLGRTFKIFPSSMLTGEGIPEIIRWVDIFTSRNN